MPSRRWAMLPATRSSRLTMVSIPSRRYIWAERLAKPFRPNDLGRNFAVPAESFASFPQGETYINQGAVIAIDSPTARSANELQPEYSHRYRLMTAKPWRSFPGGTLHLASAREFPIVGRHDWPAFGSNLEPCRNCTGIRTPTNGLLLTSRKAACGRRCSAPTSDEDDTGWQC